MFAIDPATYLVLCNLDLDWIEYDPWIEDSFSDKTGELGGLEEPQNTNANEGINELDYNYVG